MQKVKTLFISDVHLGTKKSQVNKLLDVLKDYEFENLIIDLIAISTCEKLIIKKKFTKIIEDRFFDIFILEKENNEEYKLYFEITSCWNKQYINRLTFLMNN